MHALGGYILLGRLQAVATISLLAVISLLVPPFLLFSGIPAGLVVLRKGPVVSMQVLLLCLLALVIFVVLSNNSPQAGFFYGLVIWLPVYICCTALRQTCSHGWLVFVASLIAMTYVLWIHWSVEDVSAWWLESMKASFAKAFPDGGTKEYQDILMQLAPTMNAIVASGIASSLIIKVLVSRWWQSALFNQGGFRTEFYALRLPSVVMLLPLVGVSLLYFGTQYWSSAAAAGLDILFVAVIVYSFQGLAAVHRTIALRNMPSFWLILMYVLLFFEPRMFLLIACLGLVDLWTRRLHTDDQS